MKASIEIIEYQPRWPAEFAEIGAALRGGFGPLGGIDIHRIQIMEAAMWMKAR